MQRFAIISWFIVCLMPAPEMRADTIDPAFQDVALVASLLASEAGAGITGSLLSIDGGTSPY